MKKGFKHSEEAKEKMRQARLGFHWSEEMKEKLSKAHKGNVTWMKGKKHTQESKDKVSKSKTGVKLPPFTEEHKFKISQAIKGKGFYRPTGENHHKWKGGITSDNKKEREKFRTTIIPQVLKRDDYTCQSCGEKGCVLHVHHIKSFVGYLDGRLDIDNCITLCRSCHYFVTFNKVMPEKSKWGTKFIKQQEG